MFGAAPEMCPLCYERSRAVCSPLPSPYHQSSRQRELRIPAAQIFEGALPTDLLQILRCHRLRHEWSCWLREGDILRCYRLCTCTWVWWLYGAGMSEGDSGQRGLPGSGKASAVEGCFGGRFAGIFRGELRHRKLAGLSGFYGFHCREGCC